MSTTATQTRTPRTVLHDYDLHHSPAPNPSADAGPARQAHNSPAWPADHRRIPPYRAADTERDQSQIRVYTSGAERTFIAVMFTGVFLNAVSSILSHVGDVRADGEQTAAKAWRATVGRINGGIMRYPVGGEF